MDYDTFVASKRLVDNPSGFDVRDSEISAQLFPFQRDIVRWALRRGKAALFEDCGLGKTPQQLEWARHVVKHTGDKVLILAPLAVSQQTVREGQKFGIPVHICKTAADLQPGINITNYERLHHFGPEEFGGIVLDESSILKAFGGTMRQQITEFGSVIPYRLACTATPAPNDLIELINHAEFLDIMVGKEIIALFFTQDGNTTHSWRLKGHARKDFWRWMASWSVALRAPSDLGYDDNGFVLPSINLIQHTVDLDAFQAGMLFATQAVGLNEQRAARRSSLGDRVKVVADLVNGSDEPWLIWCDLNDESAALAKAIPDAVEVKGADSAEYKESSLLAFSDGDIRVLVTKPSIAGFGMNWQHCHNVAFCGLSHSYEQYYQAIRRVWRFGQQRPVDVHIVVSRADGAVVQNIERKERQAMQMFDEIVKNMSLETNLIGAMRQEMVYQECDASGPGWQVYLGDSVKIMDKIESNSIGLSVFSPPFPGMYTYTNSPHDIGNSTYIDEMIQHFGYLVGPDKLWRVTMPGRMACVHLMQLTAMKSRDGYIGVKDYRGRVIQMMEDAGWVYAGEVTIDKSPQIQATRNKERGLLFKSLATDSSMMRMALADYLIYFRKPGENPQPIRAGMSKRYNDGGGWITEEEWIEWAAPVWYRQTKNYPGGIRETDVLNVRQAKETDDERHLCPLQIGVIERAIKLWSAPGDLVLDPFSGIGSTGYVALKLERRYVGIELKESYWQSSIENLRAAEVEKNQMTLFDLAAAAD